MKKGFLYLLLTALIVSVGFSCSSDDDDSTPDQTSKLVGTWQLTNIDFTYMAEGGFPASDACIVEMVSGYEFRSNNKFYFILAEGGIFNFDPYASDYWTWTGDESNFEINQTNPMSPPYNFGLQPTNVNIQEVNGKWVMTFHSNLSNGSKANFRLVKQDLNTTQSPLLTDADGNPYECNFGS